jgi:hypothetical protein
MLRKYLPTLPVRAGRRGSRAACSRERCSVSCGTPWSGATRRVTRASRNSPRRSFATSSMRSAICSGFSTARSVSSGHGRTSKPPRAAIRKAIIRSGCRPHPRGRRHGVSMDGRTAAMAKFPFTDADIDNVELVRQMVLHRLRTDATYSDLGGAVGTYDQLVEFESPDYGLRQPPARRSRTPEAASAVRPTRDREIGRMHTHRRGQLTLPRALMTVRVLVLPPDRRLRMVGLSFPSDCHGTHEPPPCRRPSMP